MKYTLKSFSQDIHLNSPDESQHFLVFDREDGTEFRIPVPQETIIALTKNTLAYEAKKLPAKELDDEETQQALEEVEQEFRDEAEDTAEAFEDEDFGEPDDLGDASVFGERDDLEDVEPAKTLTKQMLQQATVKARRSQGVPASEDEIPSL